MVTPMRQHSLVRQKFRYVGVKRSARQRGKDAKRKAAMMAGREIDRLGDRTATREEQHDESAGSSKARENFAIFVKTKAETKTLNKRIRPGDPQTGLAHAR
jgi:hypothetical protein